MQINHIVSNSLSKHTNNSTKTTHTPDIIESKSIMRSSPKNYSKKQIRDLLLPRTHQKINSSIHHEDYYTNFLNELNKEKRNSIHLSIIQLNKNNSHSKKIKNVYTPTNLSSEKKNKIKHSSLKHMYPKTFNYSSEIDQSPQVATKLKNQIKIHSVMFSPTKITREQLNIKPTKITNVNENNNNNIETNIHNISNSNINPINQEINKKKKKIFGCIPLCFA